MTSSNLPNPYVGPRSFQPGETLYGRDRDVADLLGLLIAERIVLLHSPSGAGKTSLIQAALLPRLADRGFQALPIIRVSLELRADLLRADPPRNLDNDQLLSSLLSQSPDPTARSPALSGQTPPNRYTLSVLLSLEEGLPPEQQLPLEQLARMTLLDYLNQRLARIDGDDIVLIFDQFEEILTLDPTDHAGRTAFFKQVGAALHQPRVKSGITRRSRVWGLFAMREDYVASLEPYVRLLPTRLKTSFRLDFLSTATAHLAIQQPARQAGVEFSDAAATRLIDDLRQVQVQQPDGSIQTVPGSYVEPVQLQVVCRRLWEHLAPGTTRIEPDDILALGQVSEALAGYYAESVQMAALATGVRERDIREWCDCQLIVGPGIRGQVMQGATRSEGLDNQAIRYLIDAHLVRAEKRRGATWFELAHDRLIEPVRSDNAAWFATHLSVLERQAALWDSQGRTGGLLLRDQALVEAEAWAAQHATELLPREQDFLAASRAARAIAEREARAHRRIRWLAIIASIVSVVAVIAFIVALLFYNQAVQRQRLATARALAAAAIINLDVDPERSTLLALHAVAQSDTRVAVDALQRSLASMRIQQQLAAHNAPVYSVAFSPDATRLASAGGDGMARIWQIAPDTAPALLLTLSGHTGDVNDVAFSPDGSLLATAGNDGTVHLWNSSSGEQIAILEGHTAQISRLAFSPDGTRLATAGADYMAIIWDVASAAEVQRLELAYPATDLAFSPDGTHLATCGMDPAIDIWEWATAEVVQTLEGTGTESYTSIAYSPDGYRIVASSSDGLAIVWDAQSGAQLLAYAEHSGVVRTAGFSPDGTRLVTASDDQTARVSHLATNDAGLNATTLFTLAGHSDSIFDATFSPDGTRLATASGDGSIRIWDATVSHLNAINALAFSPDAAYLASGSADGTAQIWRIDAAHPGTLWPTQAMLNEPAEGNGADPVVDVAFSPDTTYLTSVSWDGSAARWQSATGERVETIPAPASGYFVALSQDASYLASANQDGTFSVWQSATGQPLTTVGDYADWSEVVAFSPDSTLLATTGLLGNTWVVQVWSIATGTAIQTLPHTGKATALAFSHDSTCLATADGDGMVRVWQIDTGQQLAWLPHTQVSSLAFNPDDTYLATASSDGIARIWNIATETLEQSVGHFFPVRTVAFNPAGTYLFATAGYMIYRYPLDTSELYNQATARLTRTLTPAERQEYVATP